MLYLLFPARAAFVVNYSFNEIGRCFRTFESGFSWRLFRDLNPVSFSKVALTNSISVYRVSVSTTNSTKSHFKAHFSLSFATVSLAIVSLYFKCALEWRLSLDLNQPLLSLTVSRINNPARATTTLDNHSWWMEWESNPHYNTYLVFALRRYKLRP